MFTPSPVLGNSSFGFSGGIFGFPILVITYPSVAFPVILLVYPSTLTSFIEYFISFSPALVGRFLNIVFQLLSLLK